MSRLELFRPRRPSLLERLSDTIRSYTIGPLSLKDPEIRKYFAGAETSTGVSISEYTALNYSAVWSAVKLISSDVAGLPLVLYRREGEKKKRYDGHPLYRIIHDAPNPEMSSFTLRQTMQAHCLTWGNGYAEIERDGTGRPKYLWPITPERVTPKRDDSGRLVYKVTNEKGPDTFLDPADMVHVPGLGWDGVQGYGVIAKARESVALGVAAERFGGTFYGNGSTFGGTITHPTRFSTPLARENFEKSLRTRHKGVDRAHGILLLEEGMSYAQMGIPPDQAQFLESRQFQITEIARWFNVPPHKIGDLSRATFSNIEQQNIEYLQTTLIHWLETWEQELMRKLISPLERNQQFIEHVVEGLLRGDSQGRAALQTAEFQIGGLTPNEARGLSNRDPVGGGDRPFVPMNMIPLDRVDDWIDAQIEGKKAKVQPPAARSDDPDVLALREAVTELRAALASERDVRAQLLSEKGAAVQRGDDLSVALAQMEERAEQAEAGYSQALEHLDGARTSLAAAQAERGIYVANAEASFNSVRDQFAAAEKECGIAYEKYAACKRELETAKADAAALAADVVKEIAERQQVEAERDEQATMLAASNDQVMILRGELEEVRVALTAERDGLRNTADGLAADLAALKVERDSIHSEALEWRAKATDATAAKEAAERVMIAAHVDREAAIQRAEQADRDKAIAEQAQAAANATIAAITEDLERTKAEHRQRVSAVLVSHRGLIVATMRRLIEREIDRATRHKTTPEKFRSWIDAFYSTHVDVVAEELWPSVHAHLSVLSSSIDSHDTARKLAEEHVAESAKQLRDLLHVDDFHPMLERTMEQWRISRPELVADRLLTKGLADVR